MYGIFASWAILWVHVGKYTIHGVNDNINKTTSLLKQISFSETFVKQLSIEVNLVVTLATNFSSTNTFRRNEKQCRASQVEVLKVLEVLRFQSHRETLNQLPQAQHVLRHLTGGRLLPGLS